MKSFRIKRSDEVPGRMIFYLILLSFFLIFFGAAALSASHPPYRHFLPAKVNQGEPFLFQVFSQKPLNGAEIEWLNKKIWVPAHKEGKQWSILALLGVGLAGKPGKFPFKAVVATPLINLTITSNITVVSKVYPQQRLTLPPSMVTPDEMSLARIRQENALIAEVVSAKSPVQYWRPEFTRPAPGTVSTPFGFQRIINGQTRAPHRGVDFRGALGTPVHAWSAGVVALTAEHYFGGNSVYVDHGVGVITSYLHLSEILVAPDELVSAGQVIGLVGSTGRSTGPHLHFGLSILGQWVNPLALTETAEANNSKARVPAKRQRK